MEESVRVHRGGPVAARYRSDALDAGWRGMWANGREMVVVERQAE